MIESSQQRDTSSPAQSTWRNSKQPLLPLSIVPTAIGDYDLFPAFPLPAGEIKCGYAALAKQLSTRKLVVLDGYGGVFWENIRHRLDDALDELGVQAAWCNVADALHPSAVVEKMVAPFLGGDDPLFGTRFTGTLAEFFDPRQLGKLRPDPNADLNIIYGCGADLAGWGGYLVYFDLPKHEIQYRGRAGNTTNLGVASNGTKADHKTIYKRFYFVDRVALNAHKAQLLPKIDVVVDEQRPDAPTWTTGEALRAGLTAMSHNYFRVRPWFEAGAWGGQWLKQHIPQLPQDEINYAWSFELITPENGLVFRANDYTLEVSFDFLMMHDHQAILGNAAERFGYEFPIRFDFLDTIGGGNLSMQCHPRSDYIQTHFGESFTQDETYYILACEPQAKVYLGFRDDIDPVRFRTAIEESIQHNTLLDVANYVNIEPAEKHALYLIPSGTIHSSGEGNFGVKIQRDPLYFYLQDI